MHLHAPSGRFVGLVHLRTGYLILVHGLPFAPEVFFFRESYE